MAYLPLIALIVGLLMYLLCTNAKAAEVGRIMFFCALLAIFFVLAPASAHLLSH